MPCFSSAGRCGRGPARPANQRLRNRFRLITTFICYANHPPCRLSLRPYDLSPSYANVFNKFSVRYFINLVLVDEEDRRYFKQQVRLVMFSARFFELV